MTNSKSTKRALVTSALAILMCVAMLIGTTFAWFTDTASTGVNKIQAGNLKMEVSYKNTSDGEFKTLNENTNVFMENALWEPGHVEYAVLNVKNVGTLALKYKLGINIASETGSTNVLGNEFKLSDYIKFAVIDGAANVTDRTALVAAAEAADSKLIKEGYSKESHLDTTDANETVTLVVWMPETVGNDANYAAGAAVPEINLGINVVATQYTYESDSFNDQYDADAPLDFIPVSSAEELKAAFANVEAGEDVNVSLTGDVTISDATLMVADENTPDVGDIYIQGNGHTITNTTDAARCIQLAKFTSDRKITISSAKIVSESTATNSNERRGLQIFSVNNATINLVNCDIEMKSNDYSYPVKIGGTSENLTVNITGCTLTGANCIESFGKNCTVNITDCVLNSNYAPNATYCGNGIQDKNGTNNIYNIKDTTFNGTNAQAWQTSATTTINDLGGNVDNTTRTTE